jgi:multiple sugar transport system substrate-binding protein
MKLIKAIAVACSLCALSAVAQAKTQVVWWDFLSGGDGVRMKSLIQQFNTENPDIEIQPTTLEWGVPFYTKVQTGAAVGQGPDVMTYHLSRLPLGVSTGTLRPYTMDELKSVGLGADDYFPTDWDAAHVDGKLYAVPLDIHSIILYYNKDALKAAGLLGDDGLPKGLDGLDNFNAALKKLSGGKSQYGVSFASSDGATIWRIFYTLLNQQGGVFLKETDRISRFDSALHLGQGRLPHQRRLGSADDGRSRQEQQTRLRMGRDPDSDIVRPDRDLGGFSFLRDS